MKNILRYNDTQYALPILLGTGQSNKFLNNILSFHNDNYDYKLPINNLYGSTSTMWNGGRPVNKNIKVNENIELYFKDIKSKGINIFFTFSSYLAGDYLNDDEGNKSLDLLSKITDGKDGVIISDDRLLDYVKINHPKLITKASFIKTTKEMPKVRTAKYYNDLLKRYDIVVLHPDDNRLLDLINDIEDIGSIEVLIDERCTTNCTIRDYHYDVNALANISLINTDEVDNGLLEKNDKLWKQCPRDKLIAGKKGEDEVGIPLYLTTDEIDKLYKIGIRHFKTSGRGTVSGEYASICRFLETSINNETVLLKYKYFA